MNDLINKVDVLSKSYIQPDIPHLNENETEYATSALNKPIFSQVVRSKNDPRIDGQEIGLFSFTPSMGAKPDQYGVYGVAKLRGNFKTPKKAAVAAERIIREVDSINEIYHVRVGETFPLTKEPKWTADFDSVDLKRKVDEIQKAKEIADKEEEERERKEILNREKKLLEENKEILNGDYKEDPLDVYIRLNVARAQLKWTKQDTERKINEEIVPAIEKRSKEIAEMDEQYPDFRKKFLEKYMEARQSACLSNEIPENHEKVQQGFLKYLVEDDEA
jgi:hypothetical protein